MAGVNVPLARPIILGTKGKDVIAVKRALSRAGYVPWGHFTDVAGLFFIKAIHEFQNDHGIQNAGYGVHTHEVLTHTMCKGSKSDYAWDSYSVTLETQEYTELHTSPETLIRNKIIQAARNIYAHGFSVAYSNGRPFPLYRLGGEVPTHLDCSGFVIDCYYAAGAKDPQSEPYDGEGYTGTLLGGGRKVASVHSLKKGDLIFYGFTVNPTPAFPYGSPTHVALYDGEGGVYSMGHYPIGHFNYFYGQAINCYVTYDVVP